MACSSIFCATSKPPIDIDHAFLRRIINHARGKHRAQNPLHMIVEFGLRDLSGLHRFLQVVAVENPARLFMVKPGGRCLARAVRRLPVARSRIP